MTARQPSVGTFAWMHDVVRTEENLWRQGLITAREAVEVMMARLTCLDVKREASAVIDWLLAQPRKTIDRPESKQPEVGIYVLDDGTIVKAQPNKAKTNVYTLRWVTIGGERLVDATEDHVHGEWEYAPELKRQLDDGHRMTLEQAKDFILRFGQCVRCGRRLKAAQSVEEGIGPVCRKYFEFAA